MGWQYYTNHTQRKRKKTYTQFLTYLLSPINSVLYMLPFLILPAFTLTCALQVKLIERLPGPPALPILGNALDVNIDIVGKYIQLYCKCFYGEVGHSHLSHH